MGFRKENLYVVRDDDGQYVNLRGIIVVGFVVVVIFVVILNVVDVGKDDGDVN